MPPGQPLRVCADCGLIRPCRTYEDRPLCVDCNPGILTKDDDPSEIDGPVATDGGDL